MNTESVRQYCLSLPHSTETVQWGADLVFKIGGRMFAVMCLEPAPNVLSFKCTPESFYELQEIEGMIPAPYMARAQWLAMRSFAVLRDDELSDLLATSYRLVYQKLTKKQQAELASSTPGAPKNVRAKKAAVTKKAVPTKKKLAHSGNSITKASGKKRRGD